MQINKTNNVIFLKDNVKFETKLQENMVKSTDKSLEILKEAEYLINEEINKSNLCFEKYKFLKLQRRLKIQQAINILCILAIIIFIIK